MLVISNPPYNVAEKVTKITLQVAEESVILMPFGKYKNGLYKYVKTAELANKCLFLDKAQDIQPNLLICLLTNVADENKKLTDLEQQVWEEKYKKYYLRNFEREATFEARVYGNCDRAFVEKNLERILFTPYWPHVGNCMKEKSVTRKANLGEKGSLERILKSNASYSYFIFKTKQERDNAYNFWVTDLNNQLIFGCLTRSLKDKFPHVDWTKSWLEEEIEKEMIL